MTEEQLISMTKDELIEFQVKLEFDMFDKTRNEGGRASCQDDWETFYIMRKSQYLVWTKEMLVSLAIDFENAAGEGWNMVTEKYARMMEYTVPDEYEKIKDSLPEISEQKKAIIDSVAAIQVRWMEEFAQAHPNVIARARNIHSDEDTFYATSSETYLKGELMTYSDNTLYLYAKCVADMASRGENMTEKIMYNTIQMYGYKTFDEVK